jgi:hypothetical protein
MPRRVKTTEESASICGFDSHKRVKGRKRHLLVDTLGIPLSIYVTPADVHDSRGARCLLAGLAPLVPRLKRLGVKPRGIGIWKSRTDAGRTRLQYSAPQIGSGANVWLAFPQ